MERLQLADTGTVYFLQQKSKWQSIVSSDIAKKLFKIKPQAFYLFNNQPYILFFDLTAPMFLEEREAEIHKQVWSFDQSPLVFILKNKDLEIYNALSYSKRIGKLEQIKLDPNERIENIFSFWNLQSGDTWRWLQEKYYKKNIKEKRVNQKLFENIKGVREALTNRSSINSITENDANILILRHPLCI